MQETGGVPGLDGSLLFPFDPAAGIPGFCPRRGDRIFFFFFLIFFLFLFFFFFLAVFAMFVIRSVCEKEPFRGCLSKGIFKSTAGFARLCFFVAPN